MQPVAGVDVLCLTGTPGAGKTTVAELVAARVPAGVHVPVDFFRKMVRAGYASPHHWDDEVARQYRLARRAAASTARIYADAGFLVILDDIVIGAATDEIAELLDGCRVSFVLLDPPLDVALSRNDERSVWTVDRDLLHALHDQFRANLADPRWTALDNGHETPGATAERVLALIRSAG